MRKTVQVIGSILVMLFFIWIGMQIERRMTPDIYKVIDKQTKSTSER